jgi:hypothetical protein
VNFSCRFLRKIQVEKKLRWITKQISLIHGFPWKIASPSWWFPKI